MTYQEKQAIEAVEWALSEDSSLYAIASDRRQAWKAAYHILKYAGLVLTSDKRRILKGSTVIWEGEIK